MTRKKTRPRGRRRKKRISPKLEDGLTDESGAYFQGDTAEKVLEARSKKSRKSSKSGRKRSKSKSPKDSTEKELRKTLRRLERNLPKRKTLAARQRLAQRIKDIKKELGET